MPNSEAVVFVSFTIQAVTIGTFFSYGQLFAALKAGISGLWVGYCSYPSTCQ